MILLGTCGRGLENFAKEELKEISIICCTKIIAEGKILFCICDTFQQNINAKNLKSFNNGSNLEKAKNVINCLKTNLPLDFFYQENFLFAIEKLDKFESLFNLKLLEKLFIVLYYQFIQEVQEIEFSSSKLNYSYK